MTSAPLDINTSHVDLSHYIQREILIALRQHGRASYQELKPNGLEGNAYNYHLRLLKQAQLIMSDEGKYSLTQLGYLVSDAYSYASRRLMLRPHMYTVLLVMAGRKILVYRHYAGPLKGMIGLPSGKIHYGDSFESSLTKEVSRRLLSNEYTVAACRPINIRYMKDQLPVMHRPGVLWRLTYEGSLVTRETKNGQTYWLEREELVAMGNLLPEVSEGVRRQAIVSNDPIDLEYFL
ncbi:MAG TPA: hypothetical protein VFT59_02520 [Candidatus Saccharimonadales bacterium]|nr:hypothetical protein [Candidatus Saccharimonadales bacterium]